MNDTVEDAAPETSTALVEFKEIESGVAEMERQLKDVHFDLTKAKDDKLARQSRAQLVSARNRVEERRLALNKADRALVDVTINKRNAAAEALKLKVIELEEPLDQAIKADEKRREEERAERERIAAARIAGFNARIDEIRDQAVNATDSTAEQILQTAIVLKALKVDETTFEEFAETAAAAKVQTLNKLHELHSRATASEAQAKRLAEAEAELKRNREEAAARKQKEDAERAAEQDRIAAENRKKQAELDEQRAKFEAEQKEAREKAAKAEAEATERQRKLDQEAADRRAAADKEAKDRRDKADAEAHAYQQGLAKIQALQRLAVVAIGAPLAAYDAAIETAEEFDHLNEVPLELCDAALEARTATLAALERLRRARIGEINQEHADQAATEKKRKEEAEVAEKARKVEEAKTARQRRIAEMSGRMLIVIEEVAKGPKFASACVDEAKIIVKAIAGK